MKKLWLWSCSMFFVATLFGCGGGGGGGGSGGLTTQIFTDWDSVDPPGSVQLTGLSQDTEFAEGPGDPPFDITDLGVSQGSTATIRYRANGTIERIDIVTPYVGLPNVGLSWNEATGDIISDGGPFVYAGDPNVLRLGVFYNPLHPDADPWEYQTFGAWADARPIDAGTVGALSVGTHTPDNAIPVGVIGEVVHFTGRSAGIYTAGDGETAYVTKSAVSVDVNFWDRELAFSTTGTEFRDISDMDPLVPFVDALNLDMSTLPGEPLRYNKDVNRFEGNVYAVDLAGQATGQFYGPAAEELGGVFSLKGMGGSLETYSGAYGARQEEPVP
jgi:hypothetical protein